MHRGERCKPHNLHERDIRSLEQCDCREGWRVELKLARETLRFERLVVKDEEQVAIEGEATLPAA